jgi:hypothetical protein
MPVNYIEISGKEVAELVARIEDTVEGYPNPAVMMACICVAALAQNPEISPSKLQECVQATSELLASTLLDESPSGAVN